MKAYKGFNKDLQCTGGGKPFQYEIGKTYEEDRADLCNAGFHACEVPLDVFGYYPPCDNSRYCEVELDGVSDRKDTDSKRVGKKITIGAEIGIPGLVKAHVEWIKAEPGNVKVDDSSSGRYAKIGSSGDAAQIECSADHAVVVCAGKRAKIKGPVGTWITLAEYGEYDGEGWPCVCVKSSQIDGETLKADTWYTLKGGEFVEVA